MTKILYIMRHAQALNTAPSGGDKNRVLSPQGDADARALGLAMKKKNYIPAIAYYSPAKRTAQTCALVLEAMPKIPSIAVDTLYSSHTDRIIEELTFLDDEYNSALLVAHNPGVHELVYRLSDPESDGMIVNRLMGHYRPATLSVLTCPIESWTMLEPLENQLIDVMDTLDYNKDTTPKHWI